MYDSDISEFKFYEKLLENLNFHHMEVYKPTAEISGMILLQVQKKPDQSPFEQLLKDKVRKYTKYKSMEYRNNILAG